MNGAKPFVAQERDRSHTENVVKRAVQAPSRDVQLCADFGNVDGTKASRIEIIVDLADQLRRRGQRPSESGGNECMIVPVMASTIDRFQKSATASDMAVCCRARRETIRGNRRVAATPIEGSARKWFFLSHAAGSLNLDSP